MSWFFQRQDNGSQIPKSCLGPPENLRTLSTSKNIKFSANLSPLHLKADSYGIL